METITMREDQSILWVQVLETRPLSMGSQDIYVHCPNCGATTLLDLHFPYAYGMSTGIVHLLDAFGPCNCIWKKEELLQVLRLFSGNERIMILDKDWILT